MHRISLVTLLERHLLVWRGLLFCVLQKVGRIRVCLEGKAMLLCFLFWLKHTKLKLKLKRSSTSFRATGEGRSAGDILGVKVTYIWLDSTNEKYNIPGE